LCRRDRVPADGSDRGMQNDIGLPEPIIIDDMDFPPLSIEGLDEARQSELVEALGEDVFRELVESFFNDATGLIQDLHVALANHDPEKIDRTLHTIKGAAVNVGLNDIADIAHALPGAAIGGIVPVTLARFFGLVLVPQHHRGRFADQFARDAGRHFVAVLIQHFQEVAGGRAAYGVELVRVFVDRKDAGDAAFGHAIDLDQPARHPRQHFGLEVGGEGRALACLQPG